MTTFCIAFYQCNLSTLLLQALPRCTPTTRWGGGRGGGRALPSSTPALPSSILRTSILLTIGRSANGSGAPHPPTTLHICCQVGIRTNGSMHRVDRVLSFFSSRRNWDSPIPSPAGECPPSFGSGWGGGGTLACGRGRVGEPIPTRGQALLYSVEVYFVAPCLECSVPDP
jgi:hypothetical protein